MIQNFKNIFKLEDTQTSLEHLENPIGKTMKSAVARVNRVKNKTPEKKPADRRNAARPGGSREEKVHLENPKSCQGGAAR